MDPIKEAFAKAKQDISELRSQILSIQNEISSIKSLVVESMKNPVQQTANSSFQQTNNQLNNQTITRIQHNSPIQQSNYPAPTNIPTHLPTQEQPLYGLKDQYSTISTGNRGVPTNQPTIQQTNQHPIISDGKFALIPKEDRISHLKRVSEVLDSLDSIKKDLRQKFKKLTVKEMDVFAAIYQLEEQGFLVDYSLLAEQLHLTEISIRDYTRKIILKGIPLSKYREENKKILLSVPQELKKIASLPTIFRLREL